MANPAYRQARGPLSLRNMRPYHLLFLQFLPESPDTLPTGSARYGVQWDASNNMLLPAPSGGVTVVEDCEVHRLLFSWRRGIGAGTEAGFFVPLLYRGGGFMDPILSAWHRLFGIPANGEDDPAGRDAWPQFRSLILLTDAAGTPLARAGSAFGPGDLTLTLKRALRPATPRAALAARMGLKLPTGNPGLLLGSGGLDIGLTLDARYNVGRDFIFYGSLGGVLMSQATRVPNACRSMAQYFIGIEYRPNNRDSYLWQVDGNTLAVRTGHPFADRAAVTATFGYKRVLNRHMSLTASFSENGDYHNYSLPLLGGIGPDFTTSLALEWR